MICKCSKIASKSMPNPSQNAQENPCQTKSEKWWMAKRAASHRAPPALSSVNTKSPSIQQSMWLVLLYLSIDFPLVALITRREIQCVGSELATCESMVARRCPRCDPELPTSIANGDQKIPKTSQMAAKMHPKWCQNGIRNVSIELESTFSIFLPILYRFGEPFGNHFGTESE